MKNRVNDILSISSKTKKLSNLSFGRGRQLTIWQNNYNEIEYNKTKDHVFSLYLNGGANTHRIDGSVRTGAQSKLCVLPEGHSSQWHVNEKLLFLHLYIADDVLRNAYATIHDQDARKLDIDEQIFTEPGGLEKPLRRMAQATLDSDVLAADTAFAEMAASLQHGKKYLNGGLSRKVLRNVSDWVDAHIEDDIRLSDLAKLSGLSDFHFHRMFRESCGITPHDWIMNLRITRAKDMLIHSSMAEVATACGFSSQSHFIRRFKTHTGTTPGQYLRLINIHR